MVNLKTTGSKGEKLAEKYLIGRGHGVLANNYHYKHVGEIDIITLKNNVVHFVEVKTRSNSTHGYPFEAVDNHKLTKIINTAQIYLNQNNLMSHSYQFDIISITLNDGKIAYYENITM